MLAFCLCFYARYPTFVLLGHFLTVNTHQIQLQGKIYHVSQTTTFSLIKRTKEFNWCLPYAVYSRGPKPPVWSAVLLKSRQISIICCSTGLQDSSHPPPICFFLCWAQCSFLTGCALIAGLLACLDLVQTKHGRHHIAVNCLSVQGTAGMPYLSRPGENRGMAYLFAEPWPLWARDVQLAAEILGVGGGGGGGEWLWGIWICL